MFLQKNKIHAYRIGMPKKGNPPLIPLINFEPVFSKFYGKKIGFVVTKGNVGDWLIEESAVQLFNYFKIDFKYVNNHYSPEVLNEVICNEVDEFVFNGGGNLGDLHPLSGRIRKSLLIYKKPITILPQTIGSPEDFPYKKVWVRDYSSLKYDNDAEFAPDLALGYRYPGKIPSAIFDKGIWIRKDIEKKFNISESLGDPIDICKTPKEYILLASKYKKIITDRLHFAIAGLIAKREVTLLPNSYHKNKSVWNSCLKYLGCNWKDFYI